MRFLALLFIFLGCNLACNLAVASFQYTFENYFWIAGQQVSDDTWNPGNRILMLPAGSLNLDLRPDLRWQSENNLKLILRPRFTAYENVVSESSPDQKIYSSQGNLNLTDAYVEGPISNDLSYDIGLQVFQWGPAELLSPSNPVYHFRSDQRSAFYKEKGHALVRLNWIRDNFSVVAVSEPVSNNEPLFQSGVSFQPKSLVKFEYQDLSKRGNYLGIVFGSENSQDLFFGEYGNWTPGGNWSLYGDAKHFQNPMNYTVYTDSSGFNYMDFAQPQKAWATLMDIGTRFEGDWDWRLEYIYNSAGFSDGQFQQAYQSTYTLSPYLLNNFQRFTSSGLELYGKNYVYFSVRLPDLGAKKKVDLALRYLHSLQDGSGGLQFDFDRALGDSIVSYVELTAAIGPKDSEMTLLNRLAGFVGFKWVL